MPVLPYCVCEHLQSIHRLSMNRVSYLECLVSFPKKCECKQYKEKVENQEGYHFGERTSRNLLNIVEDGK